MISQGKLLGDDRLSHQSVTGAAEGCAGGVLMVYLAMIVHPYWPFLMGAYATEDEARHRLLTCDEKEGDLEIWPLELGRPYEYGSFNGIEAIPVTRET